MVLAHLSGMPAARVQYLVTADMVYLVLKPGSQHWGLCIRCESKNHFNVGPVSIWDVKKTLQIIAP